MPRLLPIAALLLCNTGCQEVSYPPPAQRSPLVHGIRAVIEMRQGGPDQPWASIVQDVLSPAPGADWRWTRYHPRFRFSLKDSDGWKLTVRLTATGKVIEAVGPQRVSFTVNGGEVGSGLLKREGSYQFQFPVANALMEQADPVLVGLDTDPCLIATALPDAGLPYCVLLHSIGFVRDPR